MCEKCRANGSFESVFGGHPLLKFVGVSSDMLIEAVNSFAKEHGRIPSPDELSQQILSNKAMGGQKTVKPSREEIVGRLFSMIVGDGKPKEHDDGRLEALTARKQVLVNEISLINEAISNISSKINEPSEDDQDESFEQCVEDASGRIRLVLDILRDKYGDEVLVEAIDNVIGLGDDDDELMTNDDVEHILHRTDNIYDVMVDTHTNLTSLPDNIRNIIRQEIATIVSPKNDHFDIMDFIKAMQSQELVELRKEIKKVLNSRYGETAVGERTVTKNKE